MKKERKTKQNRSRYLFYIEEGSQLRELSLSSRRMFSLFLLAIALMFLSVYGAAHYVAGFYYEQKLLAFQDSNTELSRLLETMESKISGLEGQLTLLEEKDRIIRLYADLPEIDKDVRQMGVGGYVQPLTDIENLDPETQMLLNQMESDISRLGQTVKLEMQSYEQLYDHLQTQVNRIESTPSIAPAQGFVSSSFGYRIDPFSRKRKMHHGLDISAPTGTPVYVTANGTVAYAKWYGGYGYTIKIDHGYGYSTIYAHLSKMLVRKGQQVARGQQVGKIGNTGKSTGPHLHYEVRYNNRPMNPVEFIWTEEQL
jgi:murein DD-endopeptidase MepM/ murein hydrolase activator NlpD